MLILKYFGDIYNFREHGAKYRDAGRTQKRSDELYTSSPAIRNAYNVFAEREKRICKNKKFGNLDF